MLVATVKALKHHGGDPDGGIEAMEAGIPNLARHLGIVREFGINPVVAVNRFPGDTDEEVERLRELALEHGAFAAEVNEGYSQGGAGGAALAEAVVAAADAPSSFDFVYPLDAPIERQDRGDREARLRRGRHLPVEDREGQDRAVRGDGDRQAADLHGEDAPLALARRDA